MPELDAAPRSRPSPTQQVTELLARFGGSTLAGSSNSLWMPVVTGALVLLTGVMSLATAQPWLFVALGPTIVLIAGNPGHPTARVRNIIVGHLVAIACAWLAVMLVGVSGAPAFLGGSGGTARMWAGAIAVALTVLIQPTARAYHPPAAATALLLSLGISRLSVKPVAAMIAGVVVVALVGAWARSIRLGAIEGKSSAPSA